MFKKVCIIGCGLIGSSLARAIKKYNLSEKIVSSNRSNIVNKNVLDLKIVDDSSSDTQKMVHDSDLIIIATPLSSYESVILKIKNSLKNGTILTDVGSVKENVISLVEKTVPEHVSWIHSHPITGTEEIATTLIITEGFGNISMASRTFRLLKNNHNKFASINGATQIRAGVMRPEIFIGTKDESESKTAFDEASLIISINSKIRVIREPHFGKKGEGARIAPGMFFTIEPMINIGNWQVKILNDGWTAVTKDKSLSAQFEHTVGITEQGNEIFTLSQNNTDFPIKEI